MPLPWRTVTIVSISLSTLTTSPGLLKKSGVFVGVWLLQFFAWLVWRVLLYPKFLSPFRGLPEPTGNTLFNGQWHRIAGEPGGRPPREWIRTIPNDGLIRFLGLLNQERLLVTSPKALSEVLVTRNYDFQKPAAIRFAVSRTLGDGLLVSEGDGHKRQRRNLMPAFTTRHNKNLYPIFWQKAQESVEAMVKTIEDIERQNDKVDLTLREKSAVLDIDSWASRTTLDIVGVAGLGQDFHAIKNPNNELNETYHRLFAPSAQTDILNFLTMILPRWFVPYLPLKRNEDIASAAGSIRAVCRDLIRGKQEKLAKNELTDADILSVALDSDFSEEELVDQLMTFLAAGHETTAATMVWAIYLLCKHPDIQARLRREIREHLPSLDSAVTSADIDGLPYLNAIVSETLRYYPPVPVVVREAIVDTSILGLHIPKKTRLLVSPGATNFDPQLWGPDVDEFIPERWIADSDSSEMTENEKHDSIKKARHGGATSSYAAMTFLHGPRNCIGQAFTKSEVACLLAAWIGRFSFELHNKEEADESKLKIKSGVVSRPANGLDVRVTLLEGW